MIRAKRNATSTSKGLMMANGRLMTQAQRKFLSINLEKHWTRSEQAILKKATEIHLEIIESRRDHLSSHRNL